MATFFNQATLTYNNNVVNSNITTGELLEVLAATKTAVLDTYSQGDQVTYVINIRNTGTIAYTDLTLSDDLGAYPLGTLTPVPLTPVEGSVNYFVNGVLQAAPTVTAGPPMTIAGISVPAGGVATVVYTVRLNQYAPLDTGSTVTNTVTVTGGGITPITAQETITAAQEANLSVTKSLSPTVVTENGQITYTFVIENFGNTAVTAADNAVITDTFNPILSGISVTFNNAAWAVSTNYTYDQTTGLFSTNAGQITVPAASFTQDPATGIVTAEPGTATLTITGTV